MFTINVETTMVPTEKVSNQSSLKGFDLSPYTPPPDGEDASSSLEQEVKDMNEEDHPQEDKKHPVEEANLLDSCSDEGGEKDESEDGLLLLSKSQRLELYNQVAIDPESSDDEDNDVNNYDEETSTTEEKETDSSTNDTSSVKEYTCLQEDEEEDYHEDDALHDKSDNYFDSTLAASLVSNHFEQFDMNAFHNFIIHDKESDVMEQDAEILFKSSDIVLEENSKQTKEDDCDDPIQKFAKSIPLLKPPPAAKLEAYLKSQKK